MMNLFILDYIKRIRLEDIRTFAKFKGIKLEEYEVKEIYYYIKNEYKRFFNNPEEVLNEIKNKVSPETYDNILFFYNQYKTKIS